MTTVLEILVAILLVVGGVFGLVGSYGLIRLRQSIQKLHAPTKATTVGVGAALVASALDLAAFGGQVTLREMMVAAFLLITAPVSALYVARLNIHRDIDRADLPETGTGRDWAVFEPDSVTPPPGQAET